MTLSRTMRILVVQLGLPFLSIAEAQEQQKPKEPTYLMLVLVENSDGTKTNQQASVSEASCFRSIRRFQETGPFTLTVRSADKSRTLISGRAIEIHCITPSGNVVGTHPRDVEQKQ